MSDDPTERLHSIVLAGLRQAGPQPLAHGLRAWAQGVSPAPDISEEGFRARLLAGYAGHPLVEMWRRAVTAWDFAQSPAWSTAPPCTEDRRADIYELLALAAETRTVLTELVPVAVADAPTVISTEFTPWYTPAAQQSRTWYWPAYQRVLEHKGWPAAALAALDEATDRVVERLADPATGTVYQSKGLVVGHVQSGKTANFTGVIAKAIDSGYRLVIVLAGTLNLLRQQTQRRLDMELVGRENILRGGDEIESDYADDPEWHRGGFLAHGGVPSVLGAFDIMRMTTRDNDYKRLLQGITALEFEKQEPALPLYDPRNLHRSAARLMVVKKNKTVLTKLLKDLKKIRTPLAEIPVLIIDDESDQASVNTSNPRKLREGKAERTAINGLVSSLLALLPRSQYVGYTATPFANVFIDPSDTADIFPKDFIVSLPAPAGYMGIRAFHDLDSDIPWSERTYANSQGKAHIRDIPPAAGEDDDSLQQAVDAFVLSAAVKLYREEHDPRGVSYPHHTMLVHESVRTADHRALAERLTRLWHSAGYLGPSGHARLRALFESDFAPVSAARADGYATPGSFADVAAHIGAACIRIGGDENPVLVVNSDKDIEQGTADFDKRSLWKILVGGAKLSRGFTVEGLTISYYRRTTTQADTLMQMGRWFGFRTGYRDLVRLYISRGEAHGRGEIDLYDAFEAVCRDEESFRAELNRYAPLIDGKPQVTPAQVPPLVAQHLSWLKPTSANKMYNAELIEIRSPGAWIEPSAYAGAPAAVRRNAERWEPLLKELSEGPEEEFTNPPDTTSQLTRRFRARTAVLPHGLLVSVLEQLEWNRPDLFQPHLTYLKQLDGRLARVDDWLLLAPQRMSRERLAATILGSSPLSLVERSKAPYRDAFSRVTGFEHRVAAERLVAAAGTAASLVTPSRGVALVYPVLDITGDRDVSDVITGGKADATRVIMAFALLPPKSAIDTKRRLVHFRAKVSALRDAPIVDVLAAPAER